MPAPAKPKPAPEPAPSSVLTAGKQEDFFEPAIILCKSLGWDGEDDWVTNDITVVDARGFVAKTLHEHFQAGARGEEQPSFEAACEHLAVDDGAEMTAISEALALCYNAGKSVSPKAQKTTVANVEAQLDMTSSTSGAAEGKGG